MHKAKKIKKKPKKFDFLGLIFGERPSSFGSAPGARSRGFGSVGCRLGRVGGSVSGASGSVAVRAAAGSVVWRTGARFGRVGAREGVRFGDAPSRSALQGSRPGGGRFGNPGLGPLEMSRVPMPGAWVDPWSWTLVDKTSEKSYGAT